MNPIARSIRVAQCGGPEVMQLATAAIDLASVGPRQVLVKHTYAGVNFIDTYYRSGLYPQSSAKPFPYIPGTEGCGTVVHGGSDVAASMVGQRVCFFSAIQGSYASLAVHDVDDLIPIAPGLQDAQATAMLTQGLTAHYLSHSCYPVAAGTTVLLNAAAGGTGLLLSQVCKLRGARVIGVCGGPEKAALAASVGKADHVVDYHATPDWVAEVRKLCPAGVDVFFDGVGKATFEANGMSVLRRRGSMVTFGNASGAVPPLAPLALTKLGSVSLQRPTMFDFVDRASGERDARMQDLARWIAEGKLAITVSSVLPLDRAAEAHALLQSGKTTGKLLLDCQNLSAGPEC